MRKYQPIWEHLKTNSQASLSADPKLHPRIIKAVIKEKYSDLAWKYLQAEKRKKWKIDYTSNNRLLVFTLVDISDQLPIDIKSL